MCQVVTTDDLVPDAGGVSACEPSPFLLCMGLFFDILYSAPLPRCSADGDLHRVSVLKAEPLFKDRPAGDQIALPAILTINAISAVLNTNEMMPCTVAVRRMILSVMPTSETCAVMPITNEK
jgi:hypothetical protein